MGGLGSGRYYRGTKSTTEDYIVIDIRKWHREKLLIPNNHIKCRWSRCGKQISAISATVFEYNVLLSYKTQEYKTWKDHNYAVQIYWTPCTYGGRRPWFICPATNCGRRIAVLYGGTIFACRQCYKLAYKSQSENVGNRATRRANKIRDKLHWEPGLLRGQELKPKGMHWDTFERLFNQYQHFSYLSLKCMRERFGL